jgi:hypothetical protein
LFDLEKYVFCQSMTVLPALQQKAPSKMTLAEHRAKKQSRLQQLKREKLKQCRLYGQIGSDVREAQHQKAIALTEGNPLAIDQGAAYGRKIAKLRAKYRPL